MASIFRVPTHATTATKGFAVTRLWWLLAMFSAVRALDTVTFVWARRAGGPEWNPVTRVLVARYGLAGVVASDVTVVVLCAVVLSLLLPLCAQLAVTCAALGRESVKLGGQSPLVVRIPWQRVPLWVAALWCALALIGPLANVSWLAAHALNWAR